MLQELLYLKEGTVKEIFPCGAQVRIGEADRRYDDLKTYLKVEDPTGSCAPSNCSTLVSARASHHKTKMEDLQFS